MKVHINTMTGAPFTRLGALTAEHVDYGTITSAVGLSGSWTWWSGLNADGTFDAVQLQWLDQYRDGNGG